ncbi:MAG: hypothetical protein ACO1TE_16870 [Prosthecobacter sp.]
MKKPSLRALLLLSLTFNGALGILLLHPHTFLARSEAIPELPAVPGTEKERETEALPTSARPAFQWRELEAPDFPTYVSNLRSIGCPELTIRDIVAGELNEIYAQQAADATHRPGQAAQDDVRPGGETVQEQWLASLLGDQAQIPPAAVVVAAAETISEFSDAPVLTSSAPAAADAAGRGGEGALQADGAAAAIPNADLIPAAFFAGNASDTPVAALTELSTAADAPGISPETAQQLSQMRTDFAQAVQQIDAAPGSGAHYRQWMKAKFASDDFFSSMHGGDALNQLHAQALQSPPAQAHGP